MEIESYLRFRDELAAQKAIWPGIWAQDNRSQWLDMIYREHRSRLAAVKPVQTWVVGYAAFPVKMKN